jgi:hypothetical protein
VCECFLADLGALRRAKTTHRNAGLHAEFVSPVRK